MTVIVAVFESLKTNPRSIHLFLSLAKPFLQHKLSNLQEKNSVHHSIKYGYAAACSTNKTQQYSQKHVQCSRPLCSLPGLQGPKIFADAIINFLIPFKSISDKNSYGQLFINEVVKIFTFQFGESVTKFYIVKVLLILMKFL